MNYILALTLMFTAVPVITLERTACFGACPIYKVTIYDDGTVEFEGGHNVKTKGRAQGQITKEALEELVREFEKIDYFKLSDFYKSEGKQCPQLWSDFPSAITSLNWKGKKKTVAHDHGCRGNPVLDQLTELENKIDKVANTDRWIIGRR